MYYTQECISGYCFINLNLDCNFTFPVDFAPNRVPFGAKSIGKV